MKKTKKVLISATAVLSLFFATSVPAATAQSLPTEKIKNYEKFTIETLSENSEGFYIPTGHKVVSAVSTIEQKKGELIATNVSLVEDYYDLNNNFINSLVKHEEFSNNLQTGKASELKQSKVLDKIQIQIPEEQRNNIALKDLKSHSFTLSETDKRDLEKNINDLVVSLDKGEFKEIVGITQADLDKVQQLITENQKNVSTLSVAMAGAYDNYYNYDYSNGNYRVQSLGSPHKYIRYTGSTINNNTASNSITTFMDHIYNYEKYTQIDMEGASKTEITGWVFTLAAMITMVVGFASGPVGWVAIVSTYGGALATFGGYTTTSYATIQRLNLSKLAAQYQNNAMTMNYQGHIYWPNSTFSEHNGF
ncbi:MAG: hypothetical protein ACE3L7_32180 [Candidatus Pristimantibacillus sp.]